jgi:hypothetical protein
MKQRNPFIHARKYPLIFVLIVSSLTLFVMFAYLYGQDKSDFPEGFDAVRAAPNSHKVIFENSLVRVLEVRVPPTGSTEPMHHHRWPSFFLSWDTGGKTPHIRYHRADGSVTDQPSKVLPAHPGAWNVGWMKPEPMHSIEVVGNPETLAPGPSLLRVEIKCHP